MCILYNDFTDVQFLLIYLGLVKLIRWKIEVRNRLIFEGHITSAMFLMI